MELHQWGPERMGEYLGVNRITVYRFETYRRRPDPAKLGLIAALPNFPLSAEELRVDYDANYQRETLRRTA